MAGFLDRLKAQVNPFDGGRTWADPYNNAQRRREEEQRNAELQRQNAVRQLRQMRSSGQISQGQLNSRTRAILESPNVRMNQYRTGEVFNPTTARSGLRQIIDPLGLSVARMPSDLASGAASLVGGAIEQFTPLDRLGQGLQNYAKTQADASQGLTMAGIQARPGENRLVNQLSAGTGSLAGAAAMAALTGGSSLAAPVAFGVSAGGEQFRGAKDAGQSTARALGTGLVAGGLEGAIEKIFPEGRNAGGIVKSFGKEALEEGLQSLAQSGVQATYDSVSLKDALTQAAQEAALGGVLGGGYGAAVRIGGRLTPGQQQAASPAPAQPKPSVNALKALNLTEEIRNQENVIRNAPNKTVADRARKAIGKLIQERANLLRLDQRGSVPAELLNPLNLGKAEVPNISSALDIQKYNNFNSFYQDYKPFFDQQGFTTRQAMQLYETAQNQPVTVAANTNRELKLDQARIEQGNLTDTQRLQAAQGDTGIAGLQSDQNTRNSLLEQFRAKAKAANAKLGQGGFVRLPGGNNDIAPDLNSEQKQFINDYAEMLEGMDGQGVNIMPDGTRSSNNSPFYRDIYAETGRPPTKADWFNEARRQLESGSAAFGASQDYRAIASTGAPIKIQAKKSQRNVPVMQMTQDKDTVTATNVNPKIKKGEKRYSVDDKGELIEDRKGAYRLFTNDKGEVTGFRVGKEYFDAKELGDLSDTNGYGSTTATIRRNIERAFGEKTAKRVETFLVDHQQEQATKLINRQIELTKGLQGVADSLGISFQGNSRKAKKVSAAIQDFGEGKIDKAQLVEQFGQDQANKIVEADKWFRSQYDALLNEMNATLEEYGYPPVPKRKDYYTHFQEPTLWESFGLGMKELQNMMSPTMQDSSPGAGRGKIDNKLAGESEYLQPNKRFNPFAQRRQGDARTADAFKAFERYLSPTLNNIYMTPSIARARVLSKAIAQDANTAGKDANKTVIQIKEWANNLAGKSNRIGDRFLADTMYGQKVLRGLQFLQRRAGANTIVGNIGSAVVQPIMLTQAVGKFGFKNVGLGAAQEIYANHKINAPIRQSKFLQRRYAKVDPVTITRTQKGAQIANIPMQVIEQTAARIAWSGAYNDAIGRGLKGDAAIKYADAETEKTVAGRSIGERPEAFTSKSIGLATMYQLEVSNYWQQFTREMSIAQKGRTLAAAYLFNLGLQALTGRSIGFNPIDAILDSLGIAAGDDEEETLGDKAKKIGQRIGGEFIDNMPFVAPAASFTIGDRNLRGLLGDQSNTGRFGVSSPISTLFNNPWMLASPFGGSQVKKAYEGIKTVSEGALTDRSGRVRTDVDQNVRNYLQGAVFGKNSIPEVKDYYNGKENPNAVLADGSIDAFVAGKKADRLKATDYIPKELQEIAKLSQEARQEALDQGVLSQQQFDLINNIKKVDDVMAGGTKAKLSEAITSSPIGESAKKLISSYNRLTDKGIANFDGKQSQEAKNIVADLNAMRPQGLPEFTPTNKRAKEYVDFLQSLDGNTDEFDIQSKTRTFFGDQLLADAPASVQKLFGAEANQIRSVAESGQLSAEAMSQAVAIDNMLLDAGLRQEPKFSNKLRRELGLAAYSGPGGSGGGGGRRKRGFTVPAGFSLAPLAGGTKSAGTIARLLRDAEVKLG